MAPKSQYMSVASKEITTPESGGSNSRGAFITLGTVMGVFLILLLVTYVPCAPRARIG